MLRIVKLTTLSLIVISFSRGRLEGEVLEPWNTYPKSGVVVETVVKGSALARAGLEPGDILLAWRRPPRSPANPEKAVGDLSSVFDWLELKEEQAPRGTVVLKGLRGDEAQEFTVEPGLWEGKVRPILSGALERIYSTGRTHLDSGDIEAAALAWGSLAENAKAEDGDLHVWIALRIGAMWGKYDDWEKALTSVQGALKVGEISKAQIEAWDALGVVHERRSEFEAAENAYSTALEIHQKFHPQSLGLANNLMRLGKLALTRGELDRGHEYTLRALQIRNNLAPQSLKVGECLNNLGSVALDRGELDRAFDYFIRSLEIDEQLAPDSLSLATTLNNLGRLAKTRGELDRAHDYYFRALQIKKQLAPQSLKTAIALSNLGLVYDSRGELDRAHAYHSQALRIKEQLAPQSLTVATSLNNLGLISEKRGSYDHAHHFYLKALQIKEQLAPQSLGVASVLNNLGILASGRGDYDHAHDYHNRALRIKEQLAPQSLTIATSLNSLGLVAQRRGDFDRALDYHLRALKIKEQLAPQSLSVATSLNNLGAVAWFHGKIDRAHDYFTHALHIGERLASQSLSVASTLNNLGFVARKRGDYDRAHAHLLRALRITDQLAPLGLRAADSLHNLGSLARDRGDFDRAADYYTRALRVQVQLAPQSFQVARSLNNLGAVAEARGMQDRAREYYSQALEILEHQVSKLGGSYNIQAGFHAQHGDYYHDMLNLLLTQSRFVKAFHVLERSRARTFLTMLAERDTTFTADIPKELDRERRQIAVHYDRTLKRLSKLNLRDHSEQIEAIRRELEQLNRSVGDLEARIRQASPRLATLNYPRPLDAFSARQELDPGTIMLSYSVGEKCTAIFALSRTRDLQVKIVPIGEDLLRSRVENLLHLVRESWSGSRLGERRRQRFQAASEELFDTLFEPVVEQIAASERLLILPDGPLHALPFAALVRAGEDDSNSGQYLVEWKPFHVALSATVYAELKQRRYTDHDGDPPQTPVQVAAFGDPRYPSRLGVMEGDFMATHPADAVVRSAAERGIFSWKSLPHTRREVEGIASLFPEGVVHTFLGSQALEERVKNPDLRPRILHLAAHAYTDEHLPLNSFVALTIPDNKKPTRDNGLLQVWEIFEQVRLDADLVVLSACESGLGQELGSEGLIGLTRAFHYAGARSVAASLWRVADEATAELIIRFYRHLRSGLPKDEALRAAQLELIRGPIEVTGFNGRKIQINASAPYFWAAFQIFGDWQ